MKNRFLVLLITLAIIFSAFNFAYASDVSFVDYGDAELLDHLGIMQIMEETEYSKYITREDFAYSVAMLMGLSADANVRYYTDLRAESFAFG